MKLLFERAFILNCLIGCVTALSARDLYQIDKIAVIGSGTDADFVVTESDIERRAFDGGTYTADDLVQEWMLDQSADLLRMTVDDDDITRFLQKAGYTDDSVRAMQRSFGYANRDELYNDFRRVYRAARMLNYEVESALSITDEDLQAYYQAHPVPPYEAEYLVEVAFIAHPEAPNARKNLKRELDLLAAGKKADVTVSWDAPVWNKQSELDEKLAFLVQVKPGSVTIVEEPDGFLLVRLKDHKPERPVPLEVRRREIMQALRAQKVPATVERVKSELRALHVVTVPPITNEWLAADAADDADVSVQES